MSDELEQLEFKLEKLLGFINIQEKLENIDEEKGGKIIICLSLGPTCHIKVS